MSIRTFLPADILKPLVKSFAISQEDKAGDFKVLPDTSIIMGFQCSGELSYIDKGESISLTSA